MVAFIGILAMLSGIMFGCTTAGDETKGNVVLGYVEWDSEIASTNVIKTVLEDEGYNVTATAVDAGIMWRGLAQGDFDAIVAAWLPDTHGAYYAGLQDNVENLGPNLEGAKIGLVVPAYVDIDSIEEINDVKEQFNQEIIGIEPGAGIMSATERAIEEYDLDFVLRDSSSPAMAATLSNAIQENRWVAVTGWTPHWKFAEWDLKYLDDPKGVYGGEEHIATVVREGFKEDLPEAYEILDKFYWETSDMEEVMLDIYAGATPEEAARAWVNANQDKVANWIN